MSGIDYADEAALGLATYGLAAERAATPVSGTPPGPLAFRTRLIDEVAALRDRGVAGVRVR